MRIKSDKRSKKQFYDRLVAKSDNNMEHNKE
jgi:hypothetical protein